MLLLITSSCSGNVSQAPDANSVNTSTEAVSETAVPADSEEYILPEYYDYSGGELPADIVTPIEYTVERQISADKPVFSFEIYGRTVQSYRLMFDETKYYIDSGNNKVQKIVVECSPLSYHQELMFEETDIPDIPETTFGFDLDDWNFDGYLDISLWKDRGGTSLNAPHYYWLWDNEQGRFVINKELGDLSEETYVGLDYSAQELIASIKNPNGSYEEYYVWKDGGISLQRTVNTTFDEPADSTGKYRAHITVKEPIDGEMQVTAEYYDDSL
ncbi:hypothetical protein D3C73_1116880 [compost metagenome]